MSEKHSELPWRYNAHYKVIHYSKAGLIEGAKSVCDMRGENADANAAFIIEACNNYEAVKKENELLRNNLKQAWDKGHFEGWMSERETNGEHVMTFEEFINELLNK